MFTGIIETLKTIKEIRKEKRQPSHHSGLAITTELQIDQSVAHNGICLTVVSLEMENTNIDETIKKDKSRKLETGTASILKEQMN
jgi:riboflavin synthase